MLFSGITFIVYFLPIAMAGYYILRFSRGIQNAWLLLASLAFYAWGEPVFVLILIFSSALNYAILFAAGRLRENRRAAGWLTASACAFNLTILFAFKHVPQIIGGAAFLLAPAGGSLTGTAVPIGLSFYTLRAISFAIDVYKGAAPPKNPIDAALYLTFFPTMIAGPVMRSFEAFEQIKNRRQSWQGFSDGVCRFITGLAKKVLVANSVASIADYVFSCSAMSNEITQVPSSLAWLGAASFMLQIYFDLSGYSDMSIGLGRMFGFELEENFDYPYSALSVDSFWSRWNITLFAWFREYVYCPLGGSNVKNKDKMVRNLFILWLAIGIWHGARLTFILWGVWQFFFVVLERVINFDRLAIPSPARRIYVLAVILLGLVMFRAGDIYQATLYFSNMLGLNHNGFFSDTPLMLLREYWLFIAAGILFSTPAAKRLSERLTSLCDGRWEAFFAALYPALMMAVFFLSMAYLVRGSDHPFIYFNF